MTTATTWGRIYAIINHLTPNGLSPERLNSAANTPGLSFPTVHTRIVRHISGDIECRLIELMDKLAPEDMAARYDVEAQGHFFLGYYHEKSSIPERQGGTPGRPLKGSDQEVDWSGVDWGKGNAEIARDLGVSRQTVASRRKRNMSHRGK